MDAIKLLIVEDNERLRSALRTGLEDSGRVKVIAMCPSGEEALESCLGKLSSPERELVLAPYLHHGRIKELAELGGTSANALYKKLGRLRNALRNCIKERMAQS